MERESGMTRALVLRAPAINCDRETAQACRLAGFEADLMHINQLLKAPDRLLDYQFLVIPGGFSYGDDLGAGTLLAKNLQLTLGEQLQRFVAEGRPVLGICNGFQVLVRSGLLPGIDFKATLTDNVSGQYECRWVTMNIQPSACIFTRGLDRALEIPVAHGEGQFVLKDNIATLFEQGQIPLVYTNSTVYATSAMQGRHQVGYPDNPNGSIANVAGVCNRRGNVFGMMPHPERFIHSLQHPQRRGLAEGEGDGLLIFKNAFAYASTLGKEGSTPQNTFTGVTMATADTLAEPSVVTPEEATSSYAASGVNIAAADQAKQLMEKAVRASQGPEVLDGMGAFAGVFDAQRLKKLRRPAIVASTDGVGTKTLIAVKANRFEQIGYDLVNHSVNDLLTQGAQPLFFMDYLAMSKLDPIQAATIVKSVAEACKEVGCALLGGETAEMPDVYRPDAFDLAGTIVGMIDQEDLINGTSIRAGDILLGLPSSGLHTNGYSLARRIFSPYELETVFPELGEPLVDALLRPHRCYLQQINQLRSYLADRGRFIKGMAHITGGGFEGNISRILPPGTRAVIETGAWTVPPLFSLLARLGNLDKEELYRTFNMGIGMVIALSPKSAIEARSLLPELATVGRITEGIGVTLS
jgi:phosphoribosylformylglycinamidine synthase I